MESLPHNTAAGDGPERRILTEKGDDISVSSSDTSSPPSPVIVFRTESSSPPTSEPPKKKHCGRRGSSIDLGEEEALMPSVLDCNTKRRCNQRCRGFSKVVKNALKLSLKEFNNPHSHITAEWMENEMEHHRVFKDKLTKELSDPTTHHHQTAPPHAKHHASSCLWHIDDKQCRTNKFVCHMCSKCKNRTRNHCSCAVASWLCHQCHCDHMVRVSGKKDKNQENTDAHDHKMQTAPHFARSHDQSRNLWILNNKCKYQRYTCKRCNSNQKKNLTRNCCSCQPGVWMCPDCHIKHVLAACTRFGTEQSGDGVLLFSKHAEQNQQT